MVLASLFSEMLWFGQHSGRTLGRWGALPPHHPRNPSSPKLVFGNYLGRGGGAHHRPRDPSSPKLVSGSYLGWGGGAPHRPRNRSFPKLLSEATWGARSCKCCFNRWVYNIFMSHRFKPGLEQLRRLSKDAHSLRGVPRPPSRGSTSSTLRRPLLTGSSGKPLSNGTTCC